MLERRKTELLMSVILILCACILAGRGWKQVSVSRVKEGTMKKTVVIDAGHGGRKKGRIRRRA